MTIVLLALWGAFAALLVNRAADCWLSPGPAACGLTRHPWRSRLVLVVVPALFVLLAGRGELPAATLAAVLVLLAVIDLEQRRLPNVVVLLALVAAVALSGDPIGAALVAGLAFVVFAALYALGRHIYGPGALGAGDVKLAALVAAAAGWPEAGWALLLGVFLAGAAAAGLLLSGRLARQGYLPYGTFLALGGIVALTF